MFEKGDEVECLYDGLFGAYGSATYYIDYRSKGMLTKGKTYTVLDVFPTSITIKGDDGSVFRPYLCRFVLVARSSSPVCRKIKQMASRRKALGYKY